MFSVDRCKDDWGYQGDGHVEYVVNNGACGSPLITYTLCQSARLIWR